MFKGSTVQRRVVGSFYVPSPSMGEGQGEGEKGPEAHLQRRAGPSLCLSPQGERTCS